MARKLLEGPLHHDDLLAIDEGYRYSFAEKDSW